MLLCPVAFFLTQLSTLSNVLQLQSGIRIFFHSDTLTVFKSLLVLFVPHYAISSHHNKSEK